jgi:hypothetical protein
MASLNWSTIGATIGNVSSLLTGAGVSSSTAGSLASTIGALFNSNPNESAELKICGQILIYNSNPILAPLIPKAAESLAQEQGIPVAAAGLAMTLGQPGVNIAATVLQIEEIIRNGG